MRKAARFGEPGNVCRQLAAGCAPYAIEAAPCHRPEGRFRAFQFRTHVRFVQRLAGFCTPRDVADLVGADIAPKISVPPSVGPEIMPFISAGFPE